MIPIAGYLFLISLGVALVATPVALRMGRRWNIVDPPGKRKIHLSPMPISGGWAIFFTISIVTWGHLLGAILLLNAGFGEALPKSLARYLSYAPDLTAKIALPYAGAACVFILGLIDDSRRMSVKSRLVAQFAIAGVLVALGLRPSLGFLPYWAGALVGVVWIVGIMNAFNFLDGLDGLSAGIALVATASLSTIMVLVSQPNMAFLLATIGGTLLGFLRYNYHPARVFLGSSGSLLIGYLMAVATVLATFMPPESGNNLAPVLIPVFILAIPIYDTTSVVLIRLLKNKSIAIGDQSHFHHRLLKLGFSHRQTVLFIWLVAFAIALSAVHLANASYRQSILIVIQIAAIFMILILAERGANRARKYILDRRRRREDTARVEVTDLHEEPSDIISTR